MKKGFTLVELLVVIAILAILAIVATPRILDLFNDAKKTAFLIDVKGLYKAASTTYMNELLKGNTVNVFSSDGENKLDLDNDNLEYYIVMDDKGKVTYMDVTNGEYSIQTTKTDSSSLVNNDVSDEEIDINIRPKPVQLFGDINKDGVVNNDDNNALYEYINGTKSVPEGEEYIYDINCDGSINIFDYSLLFSMVKGDSELGSFDQCHLYPRLFGDLNADGVITNEDAKPILEYCVEKIDIPSSDFYIYDIDCNGIVDEVDGSHVLKFVAGIENSVDFYNCSMYPKRSTLVLHY